MPRGRRVNSSGERSKQLLLEKALELFSTNGYHQTKISDIVKAANLTQPTFYLYFQSKDSLYNDLNEQFQNQFFDIIRRDLQTSRKNSLLESIQTNLKNIFAFFAENPNLTKIGFYDSNEAYILKEKYALKLTKLIEELQREYYWNSVEPRVFVESFIGAVERLTLTKLLTNKRKPEQLALDIVNIYFAHQKELVG